MLDSIALHLLIAALCTRRREWSVPPHAAHHSLAKPRARIVSQRAGAMSVYVLGEGASVELSILDSVIANCSAVSQALYAVRACSGLVWNETARFATSMSPV